MKYIYCFRLNDDSKLNYYPKYVEVTDRCFILAQCKLNKILEDVSNQKTQILYKQMIEELKKGKTLKAEWRTHTSYFSLEKVSER